MAGCCGSPLERRWAEHPTWGPGLPHLGFPDPEQEGLLRPYFGFQFVTIQTDGTTEITNFARPFGDNYSRENYVLGETVPAVPLSSVVVYPERAK